MFEKISKTQTANYVAILMFLTELFKINVTETEVESLVKAVVGLVAVAYTFYLRYKAGDLTKLGKRKATTNP